MLGQKQTFKDILSPVRTIIEPFIVEKIFLARDY